MFRSPIHAPLPDKPNPSAAPWASPAAATSNTLGASPTPSFTSAPTTALHRYLRQRHWAEPALWLLFVAIHCALSTAVAWSDAQARSHPPQTWEILTWEITSHVALLALIPLLRVWERRHPITARTWASALPWHLLGSIGFCAAHVTLMVLLRQAVYALRGGHYDFGPWWLNGSYEYLKDLRTYGWLLITLLGYRLLMLRWQGEARVLDEPDAAVEQLPAATPPSPHHEENRPIGPVDIKTSAIKTEAITESTPSHPPANLLVDTAAVQATAARYPERFLVRKLRREFLIAARDIAWVQAQANYVALHVAGHDYLLRGTLTQFTTQLDPARFVRVHRSHVVNLDMIEAIEPQDSGDARLLMRGGGSVPCSRRYRDALGSA